MIRLIAFFPLEGAAFYEEGGKTYHTTSLYLPSFTEEVENAQEYAETTMGYLDGQNRTFPDFEALKSFLWEFQVYEIKNNPALKRNRELLLAIENSKIKDKSTKKQEPALGRPVLKQLDSKMDSKSLAKSSKDKLPTKRRGKA